MTLPCRRERKFSKLPFVLSNCSWAAFWQLLGPAWAAFGLNLEPLGRLLVSHWDLLGAFGADLEVFWAPLLRHLGRLGRFLGQLGSSWPPNGCQMVAKWAPNGRQMHAKLDATTTASVNVRL